MIRLNEERLKGLYPEMTEDFSARMTAMVHALPAKKEETIVKKKLSLGLAIALALMITTTAMAASLGLFGELAQVDPDARLNDLSVLSAAIGKTVSTQDGITVTIDQAYYDGSRVFVSYQISGNIRQMEKGEGMPENTQWDMEYPGGKYGEEIAAAAPEHARIEDWLNAGGPRWVSLYEASLHDGLSLADGAYLDIIGGDHYFLEDGSIVGWKECEVPEDLAKEQLTVKAVLFRSKNLIYQDDQGLKWACERVNGTDDILFTVTKDDSSRTLMGGYGTKVYSASCLLACTRLDARGTVTLACPASWVKPWEDWDYTPDEEEDMIVDWQAYDGDVPIQGHIVQGISAHDATLEFEVLFRHGGQTDDLRLVPVYRNSGAHPDEGFRLEAIVNQ